MQTPAVTETHRGSPYAPLLPVALTQPALVAASLLAVVPKAKP